MSEPSATRTVIIGNRQGLHARAAVLLAELARRFESKIELVTADRRRVLTTEVLQTLSLGCAEGEQVELVATGRDAEAALEAIADLFARKFDEETETSDH